MSEKGKKIYPLRIRFNGRRQESFISESIIYSDLHHAYISTIKSSEFQRIGSLIIDFIETEMTNKEQFLTFVNKWGIGGFVAYTSLLGGEFCQYKSIMPRYNENEYHELMDNIWHECSASVLDIQSRIHRLVYNCLDMEGPVWTSELNPIQRYYVYNLICNEDTDWIKKIEYRIMNKINFSEDTNIKQIVNASIMTADVDFNAFIQNVKKTHLEIVEEYESFDIASIMYLEFKEMLYQNTSIRKCKNCYKYFLSEHRIDEEYCNRIVKHTDKTCKDIGPKKLYSYKYKSNLLKKEYLTTYRTMHARTTAKGRKKIDYNEFIAWNERAKQKLNEFVNIYEASASDEEKEKVLQDFKQWLRN